MGRAAHLLAELIDLTHLIDVVDLPFDVLEEDGALLAFDSRETRLLELILHLQFVHLLRLAVVLLLLLVQTLLVLHDSDESTKPMYNVYENKTKQKVKGRKTNDIKGKRKVDESFILRALKGAALASGLNSPHRLICVFADAWNSKITNNIPLKYGFYGS